MEPCHFPITSDAVAEEYRGMALEKGGVGKAAALLVDAEAKFGAEELRQAFTSAGDSLRSFRAASHAGGAADAGRLMVKTLLAQSKLDEALKTAKEELALFRKVSDTMGEGKLLLSVAEVMTQLRDDDDAANEAIRAAEEAQAIFGSLKAGKFEAMALMAGAWARMAKQEDSASAKALAAAKRACVLFQEAGDRPGEAAALHTLATSQVAMGSTREGLRSADQALDIFLELRSQRAAGFEWLCMSQWHLEEGEAAKAVSDAEDAAEAFRSVGSPCEAEALRALFQAHLAAGKPSRALRPAKAALAHFEEAGKLKAEGQTWGVLFQIYKGMGKTKEALLAGERAVAVFKDLGERALESKALGSISSLHLVMGEYEKALHTGELAQPLVQKIGGTSDKVELMQSLADANRAIQDMSGATKVAQSWLQHFQDVADNEGAGSAHMLLASIAMSQDNLEEASREATNAHVIFGEEEDAKNEAGALRMICEIASKRDDHKAAIRAAEQARHLLQDAGDQLGETTVLFLLAQSAIQLAIREGSRVNESSRASKTAREALMKASKAATTATEQARNLPNAGQVLACSLCATAQVELLSGKAEAALDAADEGVVLFRNAGDAGSEASALLLSADALRTTASYREADEAGNEALRLFKDVGDERGQERAQQLLGLLQQFLRPITRAPQMQMQQMPAQQMTMQNVNFDAAGQAPQAAQSVARGGGPRGPALDLAKVDDTAVRSKLLEIAIRITGADDEEIENDTPLMEAGLTSNSAILLRDELQQEMPGLNLPVTLVFDYPSIAAMVELIMESSAKAIK